VDEKKFRRPDKNGGTEGNWLDSTLRGCQQRINAVAVKRPENASCNWKRASELVSLNRKRKGQRGPRKRGVS